MYKTVTIARTVLSLILATWCINTWADEVTEEQALEQARQFLSSYGMRRTAPVVSPAGQVSGLYVFNVSSGGFVIVSNDDQTVPILGFGESGNIDPDDLPDNMRVWLQGYADQIAWLQSNGSEKNTTNSVRAARRTAKTAIEPLVGTNWNQGKPYNYQCPTIDETRTVTGCVATTMAQLMYYHYAHNGFAPSSTAIPGYTTTTKDKNKASYELTVSGLEATTFGWDKLLANYTPVNPETGMYHLDGTEEQQQAVAQLMRYCGTALQMNYGLSANGGSGAYSEAIPFALRTYFGYDGGIRHCYRKNYSYAAWMDLIYSELAAERPVALGGQSTGGGHSFICDGYKYDNSADYFHINWGWAGNSDGYFPLSVLTPDEQGIGGSSSLDGFSFGQDAVIGIQPPVDGNADYCLSLEGLHLHANHTCEEFTRANVEGDFTGVDLYYVVYNYSYGSNAYDVAVQLVDVGGKVVQTLGGQYNQTKTWNEKIKGTITDLSIPSTVAGGTYYIKVMSRPNGASDWQECYDGDAYKLTATLSNDKLKLTINVPITENVTPASVSFAVSGEPQTGVEQTVVATVTGGTGGYSGDLVLRVNGSAVMGQIAHIPAGESVQLTFSYIPTYVGDNVLTLWTHRSNGKQITGSETVNITLVMDNDGSSNTSLLTKNNGRSGNVKLSGRTLTKNGDWNTLCLPFDLVLEGSPLAGADVRALDNARLTDGTLTLNFTTKGAVTKIEAGTPYIIKWDSGDNIVNPTFTGVTINSTAPTEITSTDGKVTFVGQYSPFSIVESGASGSNQGNKNEIIMMSTGNRIGYSQNARTLKCFRCHFLVPTSGGQNEARSFVLDFGEGETTEINEELRMKNEECNATLRSLVEESAGAWYTLDGRKLDSKPTTKGMYINGNRKVVIK